MVTFLGRHATGIAGRQAWEAMAQVICERDPSARNRYQMTLDEAWVEFQDSQNGGIHIGLLEARQLLETVVNRGPSSGQAASQTAEQEEQARFLDWLLHVKKERALAYEFLQKVGSLSVGPRQYWITQQGTRRAIAWESRATYPGTDSEIWDVIFVD